MRPCPDCTAALQPVSIEGRGGAVGFHKCSCGSAWLAHGQLERLLGREVPFELLGGETSRRCPDCTLTLTPVVLSGGIPVETCSTCRGTFLDWPDVVDLRFRPLELAVQPADPKVRFGAFATEEPEPAPKPVGGFACAKCGAQKPFTEGHGTAKGLVCGACVARVQPMPRIPNVTEALPDLDLLDDEW